MNLETTLYKLRKHILMDAKMIEELGSKEAEGQSGRRLPE